MHQNKLSPFNWKQTVRSVLLTLALLASFSYGFQAVMGHFGFNHNPVGTAATTEEAHGFKRIKSIEDLSKKSPPLPACCKPVMLDPTPIGVLPVKSSKPSPFKDADVLARMNKISYCKPM